MGRLSKVLANIWGAWPQAPGSIPPGFAPRLLFSCCCYRCFCSCYSAALLPKDAGARVCRSSHNWHARPASAPPPLVALLFYSSFSFEPDPPCISLPSIGSVLCSGQVLFLKCTGNKDGMETGN